MKILYLHGWKSSSGGVKPSYLAAQGHEIVEPELPEDDFAAALDIAQTEFDRIAPNVVVGSSRGGALAMNLNAGTTPLVLLCPAWKRWGESRTVKLGTQILHSREDEVIPFEESVELLRNSGMDKSALTVTGENHRLFDPASLEAMNVAVLKHR